MGREIEFNVILRLLTDEILFLWPKLRESGLQSPLKSPIIVHCHLCLDMFEGEGLISILKIWV